MKLFSTKQEEPFTKAGGAGAYSFELCLQVLRFQTSPWNFRSLTLLRPPKTSKSGCEILRVPGGPLCAAASMFQSSIVGRCSPSWLKQISMDRAFASTALQINAVTRSFDNPTSQSHSAKERMPLPQNTLGDQTITSGVGNSLFFVTLYSVLLLNCIGRA